MIDSFNIIVVSLNDSVGIDIKKRVDQKFKSLPSRFQFVNSGDQALYLLGTGVYQLVISDYDMPGMNGRDLVREIRKNDGGIAVILMVPQGLNLAKESFEPVAAPIVDWNKFLSLVQGAIPDSLQTQYGIKSHDPILDKLLKDRAKELFSEGIKSESDDNKPFIMLPNWMLGESQEPSLPHTEEESNKKYSNNTTKTSMIKKISEKGLELLVLCFVLGFCLIWVHKFANEDNQKITLLIQILTVCSFFGFFVSQTSERLYTKFKGKG